MCKFNRNISLWKYFFPIIIEKRSILCYYLGWFKICQEKCFFAAHRRAEAMAGLPLCHNKCYILKLNTYNFMSRIISVIWIDHSRFLFLPCVSWGGVFSLELVFSSAFGGHFVSYIVLLIKEVLIFLPQFYNPYKNWEAHVSAEHDSFKISESPWHLFLPLRVPEVCYRTVARPSVSYCLTVPR